MVLDPSQRGKGLEIAMQIYPDTYLDEVPAHLRNDGVIREVNLVSNSDSDSNNNSSKNSSKRQRLKSYFKRLFNRNKD